MKKLVIIPALNEAAHIGALVKETLRQPIDRVVVVDNGSTDDTAQEANQAGAEVVYESRRGYGYACAAGAAAATWADIFVFIDGDFSCLPAEIPRLLEPLESGQADLVIGSRELGSIAPGAMPFHQRFGNWLSARLMNRLYGLAMTDLGPYRAIRRDLFESLAMTDLGPYRAIRRDLFESLAMGEMTFGWPTEMTVKAAKRQARIVEVPVSWLPRRGGQSKISGTLKGTIFAAYYILGVTLKYAF